MADVNKKIYSTKKPDEGDSVESHYESEKEEDRKKGPRSPMRNRTGPIILSPSTYVEEDREFEEEKRAPMEEQKKKYPPEKVPKDEYANFRG